MRLRRMTWVWVAAGCAFVAVAGWLTWERFRRHARPDVHKVGGTILVYEIDRGRPGEPAADTTLLAEALQRRLDEGGLSYVTVRPLGPERVEIQVPRTDGDHAEDVQNIKRLAARVGNLEFKVLANEHDDREAIRDAVAQVSDQAEQGELDRAALRGEPPAGPLLPDRSARNKYDVRLPNNNTSTVTYGWVELGPQERHQLGLDNGAHEDRGARKKVWDYAHCRLGEAVQIPDGWSPDRRLLEGALFYGRAVKDRNLSEEQRRKKGHEFFVLARNPEFDPATGKQTPAVTGTYLNWAAAMTENDPPGVSFRFNAEGGRLFGELTGKNVPSAVGDRQIKRHLGIILDGLVMSAPTINSRITTYGQITGHFTEQEVNNLVNILRSGALPATLKPRPVSETTVAPQGE